MRGYATTFVSFVLTIGAGSAFADAPDMAPLDCAWGKLAAAEQTRLHDGFKVDIKEGGFTRYFADHDAASTAEAARACQLTTTPAQTEQLALGLSRRAAVEKAKKGIIEKGEDPASLNVASDKMHKGKREMIGDKLACPARTNASPNGTNRCATRCARRICASRMAAPMRGCRSDSTRASPRKAQCAAWLAKRNPVPDAFAVSPTQAVL